MKVGTDVSLPTRVKSAIWAMLVVAGIGAIILVTIGMLAASAAPLRHHQHHYLAQGDLRTAQNYQPWAWSNASAARRRSSSPVASRSVVKVHPEAPSFSGALGRGLARVVGIRPALSAACQTARALGGPCGCFASEYFFGHSVRDLWRHDAWLRFPRAAPAPGTAAIWLGGRRTRGHVAPVVAVDGDGTVTISDNIGTRRVSARGLIFVRPEGSEK